MDGFSPRQQRPVALVGALFGLVILLPTAIPWATPEPQSGSPPPGSGSGLSTWVNLTCGSSNYSGSCTTAPGSSVTFYVAVRGGTPFEGSSGPFYGVNVSVDNASFVANSQTLPYSLSSPQPFWAGPWQLPQSSGGGHSINFTATDSQGSTGHSVAHVAFVTPPSTSWLGFWQYPLLGVELLAAVGLVIFVMRRRAKRANPVAQTPPDSRATSP